MNAFNVLITLAILAICSTWNVIRAIELTFELSDNAKECFYQEISPNTTCTLDYQVVTGGQYDVDVTLEDPRQEKLYQRVKSQFDSHKFVSSIHGVYKICFSNEFSTFSHKLVYMDFQVGEDPPLTGDEGITVRTQLEMSMETIHKRINAIQEQQNHFRLQEQNGRKRAEDINERVLIWSLIETVSILLCAFGQVYILKNFFTDKGPQPLLRNAM